jgi:hypothetical protein
MITLFASIVGFIGSIIPEIIKIIKSHKENLHELAILDKKIELSKIEQDNKNNLQDAIEKIDFTPKCEEKFENKWVENLNASVRPVIAYGFFIIYLLMKIVKYKIIAQIAQHDIIHFIDVIWELEDQASFAGIISFYFGQRTFRKIQNK